MREHLVAYFAEHHKIVEAGALRLLLGTTQPLVLSRRLIDEAGSDTTFVTAEMVERLVRPADHSRSGGIRSAPAAAPLMPVQTPAYALTSQGYSPPTPGIAPLQAYGELFQHRYRSIARLLKGRADLQNLRTITELRRAEGTVSVIAMVREIRQTLEKHHLIVRAEDEGGAAEFLIPRDTPAARSALLPDEVVGLSVALPREKDRIPRVLSVVHPDVPIGGASRRAARPARVVFLADLHIGSRSFLAGPWAALVDFLNGAGPSPELAAEVRHVVVAGDLVDGIGVYPNQERDLAIHDILEQYRELGRRLAELPARLNIVVIPGNHDAVCPAEPQPALPEEIRVGLPPNVVSTGNPSTFALDGVVIEAYHGRSFDDLIPAIPGATYARPTDVMKRMLSMRHLAPIYGGRTPIAPLPRDGLVIDPAPEILVTGHAHTFGVDRHRGVLLLNASTWQSETEYQKMRNISPVPAQAAVVDLRDLSTLRLDFSDGGHPGAGSTA